MRSAPLRETAAKTVGGGWKPYPTVPLAAAVSLVVVSVLATAWVSFTDSGPEPVTAADVVAAVDLRFEDRDDGSIDVIDANRQYVIEKLEPGSNGFLRSTLRGLARARKMAGQGDETPFSLQRTGNGQLLLIDPVTDQVVDLWAFGTTNASVFARYLQDDNGQAAVFRHRPGHVQ